MGRASHGSVADMEPLADRLELIQRHILRAAEAVRAPGLSPVLVAVVDEFAKKGGRMTGGSRDAILEAEQAGDSARVAVAADPAATDDVKKLVNVAHDSLCMLKHELSAK